MDILVGGYRRPCKLTPSGLGEGETMKLMRVIVLLSMAAVVIPAAQTSVAGEWQIQRSVGGNESTQTCTFTQKESDLTGTCTSPSGAAQLTGKVDGKNVTWTFRQESSQGGTVTVVYKGTLETDTKMSGSVTAVEYGIDGEFKATKSK